MPLTLNQLRQLQSEGFDPETGERWTTDSLGNIVRITPTEVIESPERPGQPLAIRPELARGYRYEGAIREPTEETFIDPAGNIVTLRETDIRPYMFDPTLIQREADIALVTGAPGETVIPEEVVEAPGFPRKPPDVAEAERQRVEAASRRIQARAGVVPPGAPPAEITEPTDWFDPNLRENYEQFVFSKIGGDPRGRNAHLEARQLVDEDTAQQIYIRDWQPGMKNWFDLTQKDKEAFLTQMRSDIIPEIQADIKAKTSIYDVEMQRMDQRIKANQQKLKRIRLEEQRKLKQVRQERLDIGKARKQIAEDQEKLRELWLGFRDFQAEEADNPQAIQAYMDQIQALQDKIQANQALVGRGEPTPVRTGRGRPGGRQRTGLQPGAEGVQAVAPGAAPAAMQRQPAQAKPAWVPEDATRWTQTAQGRFYEKGGKTYRYSPEKLEDVEA